MKILQHLQTDNTPLMLRRNSAPPEWNDADLHQCAYEQNPELYALLGVMERVQPWQKVRILFQLLQSSRAGMSKQRRSILERITALLVATLHPDRVLRVFLALRRVRANHKHSTRAILNYILNHPHFEDLAISRRPAVVDCLEHAMGKNVARAIAKMLSGGTIDEGYLHQHLLKFARDKEWVKLIFPILYKQGTPQTGNGSYKLIHTQYSQKLSRHLPLPKTVTATNRGDISATLVHMYRGGRSEELQQHLHRYVEDAAEGLPKFKGQMALVFDASASTRSYGEREFCSLSQSVALQMLLEKCCSELQVRRVGGDGYPPMPAGSTDLALSLLDALETQPDLVAIVSDGYENVYPGDLASVVEALPAAGVETPVVFLHSKFTPADDLSLRSPAPNLPQFEFWHQEDFENLFLSVFSLAKGNTEATFLQEFMLQKLNTMEKEVQPWSAIK